MRKVILNSGNGAREFPVGKGISIGRDGDNTIQLEGQKVADKHAKIALKGNLIFVEDLDTPFGIVVNGKKVTRWALNKGDVFEIGESKLSYEEDDKPEPAPAAKPAAKAPAAKPSEAKVAAPAAKPSNPKVKAAAKAAPAAAPAKVAAKKEKPSDIKIVLPPAPSPAPSPKKPAGAADKAGPSHAAHAPGAHEHAGAPRKQDPQSSIRIKLGAAKDVLGDGQMPAERQAPRSSLAKISLKSMEAAEPRSHTEGSPSASQRGSRTSERLSPVGMKDIERDAFKKSKAASHKAEPLVKPLSAKTKTIVAVAVLVVVLGVSAAMLAPALSAWMARSSAAAEQTHQFNEAVARLKSPAPKDPADILQILPKLKLADTWEKVEDLLGTPDLQCKERIQLFNSETGVYEMTGFSFKAYYMKDAFFPNPKEGDLAPIILFMVNSNDKVSFLEKDRLLTRNANLQVHHAAPVTTLDPIEKTAPSNDKMPSVPPEPDHKT